MLIGGIHTLTLLDFPDRVACLIFTAGCNMRCGYCHNPDMVLPERLRCRTDFIPTEKIFNFLETRQGFLEGVAISGGEPTIHPGLLDFMRKIKALGFQLKLDTNGTNPEVLHTAFNENLLDYVAMDIKASPTRYDDLTAVKNRFDRITQSRDLIMNSGIEYEFRTTFIKGYHKSQDIVDIGNFCRGAQKYSVQNFRPAKTLDPAFGRYQGFSTAELRQIKTTLEPLIKKVELV